MRNGLILFIHICAALVPFAVSESSIQGNNSEFPGWPEEFDGQVLEKLDLTERERGFTNGFPGKIARFTDGSREIVMRYVERASRSVHPSADCLRGSGFRLETQPIRRDNNAKLWGCVLAEREGLRYRVCERIYDRFDQDSWYDVSSWYWASQLNRTQGPWWTVTVAERI